MIGFFQSLFGTPVPAGASSEALLTAAIERAVEQTDPWIRGVSGYRKKLRPAVQRAMDYLTELVEAMAPPLGLAVTEYSADPRLRSFFISSANLRQVLDNDPNLMAFRRSGAANAPGPINALLTMEKQEKTILGAEMSGNLILRDVHQTAVSFADHHLLAPAATEAETRRQIRQRAFDQLLQLAQHRMAYLKSERAELERQRSGLQSRISQRQRWEQEHPATTSSDADGIGMLREKLTRIDRKLLDLGREDRSLDSYLEILGDVLNRPEQHLWTQKETLIVDRMGIKRREAAVDATPITFDVVENAEGRRLVVSLVTLPQ